LTARRTAARVVGRDALLNVALLALEAAPPALALGDSDPLKEGARLTAVLTGEPVNLLETLAQRLAVPSSDRSHKSAGN